MRFPIQLPISEKVVLVIYPVHLFFAIVLVVCFVMIVRAFFSLL
jgi:hypothetical protein